MYVSYDNNKEFDYMGWILRGAKACYCEVPRPISLCSDDGVMGIVKQSQ